MKGSSFLKVAGIAIPVIVLLGLLFPTVSTPAPRGKSETRACATQLAAALKQYYTEYGKWPDFTGNGLFLDEARQARLLSVLIGKDEANNPRKIVFFESRTAIKRSGSFRGGFHPVSGSLLDSWGQAYRVALDHDYNEAIENPYPQDPFGTPIRNKVIVWSLGKDGRQGTAANPQIQRGSDDVVSWN